MKVRFQRFASLLLALVLCVGLCAVPASAADQDSVSHKISNFWDASFRVFNPYYAIIAGYLDDIITPETATPEDWQDAYGKYVINIQNNYGTTQVGPGGYYIYPEIVETNVLLGTSEITGRSSAHFTASVPPSNQGSDGIGYVYCSFGFAGLKAPVAGYYTLDILHSGSGVVRWGAWTANIHCDTRTSCLEGYSLINSSSSPASASVSAYGPNDSILSVDVMWRILVEPVDLTDFNMDFPTDSRPGSLTGITYGYQNDTGEIIVYTAKDSGMFNEEGGYLYNPVTGETLQADSWYYDYENRRYDIALKNNQGTATLEYGDQGATLTTVDSHNVTTIYNYYYMVPDGGGGTVDPTPTPTPPVHTHNYVPTVTTEPTCISPGVKTLTCSECGDTKTEKIPATGHTWVVDRTVNTTYDPNGNIVQQGYTIYKCTVCGNEYKDEATTGPPDPGGGDDGGGGILDKLGELLGAIFGGILDVLGGIIGGILDALISIVNGIAERLSVVVGALTKVFAEIPAMFSGFTDFLGAMFSFLPPEIVTILIFGILAVVLVAVLKMFLK